VKIAFCFCLKICAYSISIAAQRSSWSVSSHRTLQPEGEQDKEGTVCCACLPCDFSPTGTFDACLPHLPKQWQISPSNQRLPPSATLNTYFRLPAWLLPLFQFLYFSNSQTAASDASCGRVKPTSNWIKRGTNTANFTRAQIAVLKLRLSSLFRAVAQALSDVEASLPILL